MTDATSTKPPLTGLVLTGGGARAAYQVGAIRALSEIFPQKQPPFRVLCGTSAGAINIAYLASHSEDWIAAATGLYGLWEKLGLNHVYRTDSASLSKIALAWLSRSILGGRAGTRKSANFLLSTEPLRELISREVRFEAIRENVSRGHLHGVSFSSVQYFAGTTVSFFEAAKSVEPWIRSNRVGLRASLDVSHVMASAAIPIFFPPVEINEEYYGDGCLRQTTPLSPAIHLGAERLISIGIRHERRKSDIRSAMLLPQRHAPSLAEITGELMNSLFLDSLETDVERLQSVNDSLELMTPEMRERQPYKFRKLPILQLRPSRNLGELVPDLLARFPLILRYLLKGIGASKLEGRELISYLAFMDDCIQPLLELGYKDTLARRHEIIAFLDSGESG
ncbi:MAG: patatin-like phospholipase family protein [Oligoflexia bacterium]|nr:patatin-like phospholipase family protein [Oligoflexia bacterium]